MSAMTQRAAAPRKRSPMSLLPFIIISLLLHTLAMRIYVQFPDKNDVASSQDEVVTRSVSVETVAPEDIPDFLRDQPPEIADDPLNDSFNDIASYEDETTTDDAPPSPFYEEESPPIDVALPETAKENTPEQEDIATTQENTVTTAPPEDTARTEKTEYNYSAEDFRDVAAEAGDDSAAAISARFALAEKQVQTSLKTAEAPTENAAPPVTAETVDSPNPPANIPDRERNSTVISVAPVVPKQLNTQDRKAALKKEDIILVTSPEETPAPLIQKVTTPTKKISDRSVTSAQDPRTTSLHSQPGAALGYVRMNIDPTEAPPAPPPLAENTAAAQARPATNAQTRTATPQKQQRAATGRRISVNNYGQLLAAWITKFQKRPAGAGPDIIGNGVVLITINRSGRVLDARVIESSGHRILDDAALRMVFSASPVIAVPRDYLGFERELSFRIPFRF